MGDIIGGAISIIIIIILLVAIFGDPPESNKVYWKLTDSPRSDYECFYRRASNSVNCFPLASQIIVLTDIQPECPQEDDE